MPSAGIADQIETLNREISICPLCDLSRTRTLSVPGEGSLTSDVMFVGEGPGFNEDKQGRPFVGQAGKFLDQLLSEAGLARADVFITNIVKCRPPNNRDPLPSELAACRPYLDRQIALVNPWVIVTLGRHSLGTFFPGDMISRVHGAMRERDGRHYFAMYHPAAALHQERLRQTLIDDMRKLRKLLENMHPAGRRSREVHEVPLGAGEPYPCEGARDGNEDEEPPQQLSLF